MLIFTMMLVLLSSGAMQMAYHICDEDGVHVWQGDCEDTETKTIGKSRTNCCSEEATSCEIENPCCTEAYFFSLAPLPVSPIKFKLQADPTVNSLPILLDCSTSLAKNHWEWAPRFRRNHPPESPPNLPSLDGLCVWII